MSNYESRKEALQIAAQHIDCHGDLNNLIKTSQEIERYLAGTAYRVEPPVLNGIDFSSREHWTGTAQDLVAAFERGNTLVCKARQIGMTTLLAHFASAQAQQGKRVVFMGINKGTTDRAKDIVKGLDKKSASRVTFLPLNQDFIFDGMPADYVIVDGLTYLSHGRKGAFLTCLPEKSIKLFVGEPPRDPMGLFYELWHDSTQYQKISLTAHQPLYPSDPDVTREFENRWSLGQDAFMREYFCRFSD